MRVRFINLQRFLNYQIMILWREKYFQLIFLSKTPCFHPNPALNLALRKKCECESESGGKRDESVRSRNYINRFWANAFPEPDFRYFSNP